MLAAVLHINTSTISVQTATLSIVAAGGVVRRQFARGTPLSLEAQQ